MLRNATFARPLAGVRVLDLTQVVSGPFGSLILSNLGADVIRVQRRDGSGLRCDGGARLTTAEAFDWSLNRNKRSIELDLKSESGCEIFRMLCRDADVVFSNFRPGKLEAMGIGNAVLREINPALVTCEINGFGTDGAWAAMPAYDPVVQALSGLMSLTGAPARDAMPVRWTVPIGDELAGLHAVIGILAALVERMRTGLGRHLEIAMHDVMLATNALHVPLALSAGARATMREDDPPAGGEATGLFRAADGKWLAVAASEWAEACRALGALPGSGDDIARERFAAAVSGRAVDDAERTLQSAGLAAGRVNDVADILVHPQLEARAMIVRTRDAVGRDVTVIGDPLGWAAHEAIRPPSRSDADNERIVGTIPPDALRGHEPIGRSVNPGDAAGTKTDAPKFGAGQRPLAHLQILELEGAGFAKRYAGHILARLGARVRLLGADCELGTGRARSPVEIASHAAFDADKAHLPFTLGELGTEAARSLLREVDAVLHDKAPGSAGDLGIGANRLRAIKPDIVSCSVTAYGATGPWRDYSANDLVIQALGGGMALAPPPVEGMPPISCGVPIGELAGSLYATIGILAALLEREGQGTARPVDISLLDAQCALLSYRVPQAAAGHDMTCAPRRGPTGALPFGPYRTADDRWFMLCITDQFWRDFVEVVGPGELAGERFATEIGRQANATELDELVTALFEARSAAAWSERFLEARLPGAPVLDITEAFAHPNVCSRDMKRLVPDDDFGPCWVAGDPIKFR